MGEKVELSVDELAELFTETVQDAGNIYLENWLADQGMKEALRLYQNYLTESQHLFVVHYRQKMIEKRNRVKQSACD